MMSPSSALMMDVMMVAMMVAMMLPSFAPVVWRYHHGMRMMRAPYAGQDATLLALGYVSVWVVMSVGLLALNGKLLPTAIQSWPAGVIILCAGALQCSGWKAKQLLRCGGACITMPANSQHLITAWWQGCRLGVYCGLSCAAPMAVLVVAGLMDARMMMVITAAITAERVAPRGARIARVTGMVGVIVGITICLRKLF